MHAKMQVFLNQPRWQISALLILLFGRKKKLCLERMPPGEKSAFLHKLSQIKGHMQKLSSFGQGKKIQPKKLLRLDMQAPFN